MKITGLRLAVALVVVAFVAMGFSAALPGSHAATTSSSGGTFIFGSAVDTSVADLNPLTASNSLASILVKDMYATQLAYQWPSGNFTSWLASSWTVTNNANATETITFHLNPKAEWVNGTTPAGQITSKDVAFTFQILKDNQTLDFNVRYSHPEVGVRFEFSTCHIYVRQYKWSGSYFLAIWAHICVATNFSRVSMVISTPGRRYNCLGSYVLEP